MRRYHIAAVVVLLLGAVLASTTAGAEASKIGVCHARGDGTYQRINIADQAFPTHVNHGDGTPGSPVPDRPDQLFDDDCSLIPRTDIDGDGVYDDVDNCPTVANPEQSDRYGSARGDACEDDSDGNGVLDFDEAHICVSIDGVYIVGPRGYTQCESTASTGASPNIAVAHDRWGVALAADGSNNTAIAIGDAVAYAHSGDNNTATAIGHENFAYATHGNDNFAYAEKTVQSGDPNFAVAGTGDRNTAIAIGPEEAEAYATDGSDNVAIATGNLTSYNPTARAGHGNNNTAIATDGIYTVALAVHGNNNTATATGDPAGQPGGGEESRAYAGYGNDNSATATGAWTWARAWFGDRNTAEAADGCEAYAGGSPGPPPVYISDVTDICP